MPTYLYQVILKDGSEGPHFEVQQAMSDPPLERHPVTGHVVRRVYTAPNLGVKHTPGKVQKLTSKENLETHGFTKYQRDPLTNQYHKVAGKDPNAPQIIDRNNLG